MYTCASSGGGHLPQCGPSAQAPIAGDANAAECCVNLRRCWHQVCFSSNCCCRLLLGAYCSISSQYMGGGSMILVWEAHWQGVWERNSPSKVQGQSPGRAETQKMLYHEAKIHLWREKNKSQYRLTLLYDNVIIIIFHLTYSSFYVSSYFCLKIQNAVCGLQSRRCGQQRQPDLIKRVY